MWAGSALVPKIFMISAHAFFPFLIFMIQWNWVTFSIAVISMMFFATMEYFGYTPPVFLRIVTLYIGGKRRKSGRSPLYNRLNKY